MSDLISIKAPQNPKSGSDDQGVTRGEIHANKKLLGRDSHDMLRIGGLEQLWITFLWPTLSNVKRTMLNPLGISTFVCVLSR